MKRIYIALLILSAVAVCTPGRIQAQSPVEGAIFRQEGIASWYGPEFDGRPTASGEIFNSSLFTAAHPSLPFGTVLTVTNKHNDKTVTVKVNDRGPFVSARIIDLSRAAAEELDMLTTGTAPVLIVSSPANVSSGQPPQARPGTLLTVPPAAQAPAVSEPDTPVPAATAAAESEPRTPVSAPTAAAVSESRAPVPAPTAAAVPAPTAAAAPEPRVPAPTAAAAPAPVAAASAPLANTAAPVQYSPAVLIPAATPSPQKVYRLQVGSYRVARNAVEAFDKLKNAGLNPAYERYEDYFRVVLAGIRGADVYPISEKLGVAGFREVLLREEH